MNIVVVGHVDHGKSTIIGRLLVDTNSLPLGKVEQIREACRRNSKPFEYAFILDALKDEQSQGITIEVARCFFKTDKREYIIIDAPGHIEFLKNMVTGAARAEAAILVIDATEGVQENSRRHGYLLSMLGIYQVAVVINKMDLVEYNQKVFEDIKKEYEEFLSNIGLSPQIFIPTSGIEGDNVARNSNKMPWYEDNSVLEQLELFKVKQEDKSKAFCMPVQDVYKFTNNKDNRRLIAGTIIAGSLCVDDTIVFYPSGKKTKVCSIELFNKKETKTIGAGYAISFTMKEQIYVRRGELAVKEGEVPPKVGKRLCSKLFWLGKDPLIKGQNYVLKLGTNKVEFFIEKIMRIIDATTLETADAAQIERNQVAECILNLERPIACDLISENEEMGRFVIVHNYEIGGGGIITSVLKEDSRSASEVNIVNEKSYVSYNQRCRLMKQKGQVIWLYGLSGTGKSTIANALEEELLLREMKKVYKLDGDNLRLSINSDLGFSVEERIENVRRTAEIAKLMKDAGLIVIVALITPLKSMRELAKNIIGEGYIEVYIKTPLEICEKRDTKGLYAKARSGELVEFTGISSPFEEPEVSNITMETVEKDIFEIVDAIKIKMNMDRCE